MVKFGFIDYNKEEEDIYKIQAFLYDTHKFFESISKEREDYVGLDSELQSDLLNNSFDFLNQGFLNLQINYQRVSNRLEYYGLEGIQLYIKLALIKSVRDKFVVAHTVRDSIIEITGKIGGGHITNNISLMDSTIKKFNNIKKEAAKKWYEHIRILLGSIASAIPGGEAIMEMLDTITKRFFA